MAKTGRPPRQFRGYENDKIVNTSISLPSKLKAELEDLALSQGKTITQLLIDDYAIDLVAASTQQIRRYRQNKQPAVTVTITPLTPPKKPARATKKTKPAAQMDAVPETVTSDAVEVKVGDGDETA